MQRPCERENRTNKTRSRKHARFCEKADIVISIDPSFTLKKKKKRKRVRSIAMSVRFTEGKFVPSRIETTGSERSDPWNIARVSACQRVGRAQPPPRSSKEFVDCCTRVICASTSTKWLSLPAFQTSRVSPSVRSPSSISPSAEGRRGFCWSEGAVSLTGRGGEELRDSRKREADERLCRPRVLAWRSCLRRQLE